jgi:hypothetical protein
MISKMPGASVMRGTCPGDVSMRTTLFTFLHTFHTEMSRATSVDWWMIRSYVSDAVPTTEFIWRRMIGE